MDPGHSKLMAFLMTSLIFCTWNCQGELIPIDEEYDYGESGTIEGVSGEDENSNQHGWSLEPIRAALGMQADHGRALMFLNWRKDAIASSPDAEPSSYHSGSSNNNNNMPFLPLGPPAITVTTPPAQSSSSAFDFNAPYPQKRKKNDKLKVIVVSIVVTAAVSLSLAGLAFYLHWKLFGNGHALEEQPRSERGLLNSSFSNGSDYFKALHAAELGVLTETTDLAPLDRENFEKTTLPAYMKNDGTIKNSEFQAMSLSKNPIVFPSLEFASDDDCFHSTCETPVSDSKGPLAPWELPSSHSSPVMSWSSPSQSPPPSPSSSPPPSSGIKPSSTQITEGSIIFPPATKEHLSKSPSPPSISTEPPPPAQDEGATDLSSSQEPTQTCATARDPKSYVPPLPPLPPLQLLRANQNQNRVGPAKSVPQFRTSGRDETQGPRPKLKPLYWDKVRPPPDSSTVWNKLRSGSFEFDEDMIQSLFGCDNTKTMKSEATNPSFVPPLPKNQPILEPKKSQNIAILLRAFNITREEVCDALLQGEGLTTEQLETLVKMAPTKEEEAKLKDYDGDISKLGPAEQFIKALLDIPFAFKRVDAMLYRDTFEEEVVYIQNSLETLELACKELRCSRLFLKLLEAVLKTGNRMNVGTFRGEAQAFKLDALLKLADIKGIDGKTTLLHFVVQEIIRTEGMLSSETSNGLNGKACHTGSDVKSVGNREEDYRKLGLHLIAGLSSELCNVRKAAGIDFYALTSSLSNLSERLVKIVQFKEAESQGQTADGETSGNNVQRNFHQSMTSFLEQAKEKIVQLTKEEKRVFLLVKDITEYFHGDSAKEEAHPLRIFVIVKDFLGMLDQVCKEVSRMKKNSELFSQKGSSMISGHNSSHSLFTTALDSKPDSSGDNSIYP